MSDAGVPADAIPGYEVLGLIGQGGMGSVYEARQKSLDRVVALKLLSEGHGQDAELVKRFRREIEIHSSLTHPNLVRVLDGGVEKGQRFLVLEYLQGRTLHEVIRAHAPMSPVVAIRLARQLAAGVAYLHEQNLAHRDLKPPNAMVVEPGQVKLLDFGLARGDHHTAMTQADRVLGTLAYIAPEILEGETAGFPADVYALGLMFYEMFVGRLPYQGEDLDSWVEHIAGTTPIPIAQTIRGTPPGLSDLVHEMLEKNPRRRPTAARTLARLDDLLVAEGVTDPADAAKSIVLVRGRDLEGDHSSPEAVTEPLGPSDSTERLDPRRPPPSSRGARPPRTWNRPPTQAGVATPTPTGTRTAAVVGVAAVLLGLVGAGVWMGSGPAPPVAPAFEVVLKFRNLDTHWTDRYVLEGEALKACLEASRAESREADPAALANRAYSAEHPLEGRGELVRALPLWERAALAGSVQAMLRLGWIYQEGEGVERDPAQSVRWLESALERGHGAAAVLLARLHRKGLGVPVDHERSIAFLERGVALEDPLAMHNLGRHHGEGLGRPIDHEKALALYRQGARFDHESCLQRLGESYGMGFGVERDLETALALFRKAAAMGYPESMMSLASCYATGTGVQKDDTQAVAYYTQAAEAGHLLSMSRLGDLYWHGYGVVEPDLDRALKWLRRAADRGSPQAHLALARFHGERGEGGVKPDPALAVLHLERAVELESPQALNLLGMRYEKGQGVPTNPEQAVALYQRAVDREQMDAAVNLARMRELGFGTPTDLEGARVLYTRAAEAGLPAGQFHLARFLLAQKTEAADRAEGLKWLDAAVASGFPGAEAYRARVRGGTASGVAPGPPR